jgi:hypothetical protein
MAGSWQIAAILGIFHPSKERGQRRKDLALRGQISMVGDQLTIAEEASALRPQGIPAEPAHGRYGEVAYHGHQSVTFFAHKR